MESIRKWFYKPRRDDPALLSQFFYADEELNLVAAELDSFDGRKDPERCTLLVNHLRQCQDKVLTICNKIMEELIPDERADRDFRVKFPDDVMQDNLAGQLWFGAECLAAGSSIMNREMESGAMRPLAKALTKALENVRNLLREAALRANIVLPANDLSHDRLVESLKMFDRLLAQFELCYVSAMVPVKSVQEYELQQCVIVLFSETLQRALQKNLLCQEMVDQYDPALMFTIPRLAIVAGLLVFPEGPLSLDENPHNMSEMFRPFRTLLVKIRELLWTLSESELLTLEKMLCSSEELIQTTLSDVEISEEEESECAGETSECETVMEAVHKDTTGLETQRSTAVCLFTNGLLKTNLDERISFSAQHTYTSSSVKEEDSNSFNSYLDSGLGTNQSNSDPDSLSDKSPDTVKTKSNLGESKSCDSNLDDSVKSEHCPSSSKRNEKSSVNVHSSDSNCDNDTSKCSDPCNNSDPVTPSQFPVQTSGLLTLNGQWTLPVISCSCSHTVLINDETSMTHQGLMNRGLPLDDGTFSVPCSTNSVMCDECLHRMNLSENNSDNIDDVRWQSDVPGTSVVSEQGLIYRERTVSIVDSSDTTNMILQNGVGNSVVSSDKLINSDKVNALHNSVMRSKSTKFSDDSWTKNNKNTRGEPSVDFQVRYADNWQALHKSSELSNDGLPSKFSYSLSSDTSSFNSEYQDEEEVALAVRAAEAATRSEARAKFRSSADLIHRLFVCIAGVADQLQTNFAGDLRNILKSVFLINASNKTELEEVEDSLGDCCENGEEALVWGESEGHAAGSIEVPPPWVPDEAAPTCMACQAPFTVVRRRHHCRNCGKVFCARCSSNSVPLPRFGHLKPVRVCNRCFIYQVTPFMIDQIPTSVS
ncbi:lateral signaling target protein 2 homolog isoform X2 [Lycorma delicatula]|uniref:lateral signaling target protein 2 homolog isoform X2 n=1 Tax=Lycorma delicatula TaxID=130591 RepID=UPI003F513ECE